tara:strand:+ start:64 stop:279 length:216 start_codon:yes stop_codon:yes gene_type:complete
MKKLTKSVKRMVGVELTLAELLEDAFGLEFEYDDIGDYYFFCSDEIQKALQQSEVSKVLGSTKIKLMIEED